MINRDSLVLTVVQVLSFVLLAVSTASPESLGLTEVQANWAAILSGALGIIAGKLGTSPLKGEGDSTRVSPRVWFLPLILAASIGVVGCLPKAPAVIDPTPTAEQVQAVREQAAVLARATVEASALVVESRRLAQRAYEAGVIPAATMQQINSAAIVASDKGLAFVAFAKTVTADPSLKVTARELLRVFDGLIEALINGKQGGDTIRAALAAFRAYLGVTDGHA
jgi:hypothetical protein